MNENAKSGNIDHVLELYKLVEPDSLIVDR